MACTHKVQGGMGRVDPDSDDDFDVEISAAFNTPTGQKAVSYKCYATEQTRPPPMSTYPIYNLPVCQSHPGRYHQLKA